MLAVISAVNSACVMYIYTETSLKKSLNYITLLYFVYLQLESLEELYAEDHSVKHDVAHHTVEVSAIHAVEHSAKHGIEHGMVPLLAPELAGIVC